MERNEIAAICISGDLSLEQYLVIKKNKIDFKGILQPRIPFISEKIQKKIVSEKEKVEKILGNNSRFIFYEDKEYPQLLKEINNPPLVLFYLGDISLLKYEIKIAIVGSRNASDYGLNYTEKFAKELSEYNIVIISGMAAGIDGRAHKGALKEKGKTIAVLGSGINVPYPSCNRNLYNEICNSGLVISEYLPDTPPYKQNFPRRNRIVVGLSKGLLVTQAAFKSGSMISAKLASEFNRDVFALPGNINLKQSTGTNWLIKNGAKLVTEVEDILVEYNIKKKEKKNYKNESKILQLIKDEPRTFTELKEESGMINDELILELTQLQINGSIKEVNGKWKSF